MQFFSFTGRAQAAALLSPQYQAALFAPGAPLDIARFFIIIPDDIGHGASSKPSDGLEARFPHYRYGDMVDLQHRLVTETLGIKHLHAIIGMSMGCMNAWPTRWMVSCQSRAFRRRSVAAICCGGGCSY
jgi:homoserine O-acetyltransferase/O-succinyltransferase